MDSSDQEYENTCNKIRKIIKNMNNRVSISVLNIVAKCHHYMVKGKNIDL